MTAYGKLTDDQLVEMFAKGDNVAFDALLERHDEQIHTYIRFVIADAYLADDIFQDTFMKAICTIKDGRYAAEGKFKSWLLRIAHNLMMDHFRRARTEAKWEPPMGLEEPLARLHAEEPNTEDRMILADHLRELEDNIRQLSHEQREVLYMRYWEDLSFKEIADRTGVSINTALGRMRYALLNLRKRTEI